MSTSESLPQVRRQRFSLFHSGQAEDVRRGAMAPYTQLLARCSRVLDVGCGPGTFLAMLAEHGVASMGIDVDPDMVAECHDRGLDAMVLGAADIAAVPGRFDGIHAGHVVEHMPGDAVVAFVEASYAKLRGNGLLVVRTPNWENAEVRNGGFWLDYTHVRPYPLMVLARILEDVGFSIVGQGTEPVGWEDIFLFGLKPPAPALEGRRTLAFFYRPEWDHSDDEAGDATNTAGSPWSQVVLAFGSTFDPAEDVCLVLAYDPSERSSDAVQAIVMAELERAGMDPERIPDILLAPLSMSVPLLELAGDRDWLVATANLTDPAPGGGAACPTCGHLRRSASGALSLADWDGRVLTDLSPQRWRAALGRELLG